MPSPFPGMNPYLEQDGRWKDFHSSLIVRLRELLTAQVRPRYLVWIEEHIFIHAPENGEGRRLLGLPDAAVVSPRRESPRSGGTTALQAPTQVLLPAVDLDRQRYLEIRDRENRQVVTVLELLSPANKSPGDDRRQYEHKREEILTSQAHFVEIDLLRGGPRLPLRAELPSCDYYVLVSRVPTRPQADFWPIRLREQLPVIPIPLHTGEPEAALDLQAALHHVYDTAGYENDIYRRLPQPPLDPADAEWARSLVPPGR